MKAFFLSDLHLKQTEEPAAQTVLRFFHSVHDDAQATHLFLMGDIFDLWIGDHSYFAQKFAPIVAAIERLVKRGIEVHYFEGNHDLYLESFWQKKLGVFVHGDARTFTLGRFRVRVEHGDLIDQEDRGYLFLRWLLRTPVMRWLARVLPDRAVAAIGERASGASRHYTSTAKTLGPSRGVDKIREHSRQVLETDAVDFVITGHLHVFDDTVVSLGSRRTRSVNLGTWLDKPRVFVLDEQQQGVVEIVANRP